MAVLAAVWLGPLALAREGGIGGRWESGCTPCHGASSPAVTVQLTGPPTLLAAESGIYGVEIDGGPAAAGGFDAAFLDERGAPAGSIAATDDGSQPLPGTSAEVTHRLPTAPPGWSFTWVAPPEPGTYTLHAAGASVNADESQNGDAWALAVPLEIAVTCRPGAERACGIDVGECRSGREPCLADGRAFGPCAGEVGPAPELCDGRDNDCDGTTDDGCAGLACVGDPGRLTLGTATLAAKRPGRGQFRSVGGGFTPPPGLDPATEELTLLLETSSGKLLQVSLPPGALVARRSRWVFRQKSETGPGGIGRGSSIVLARTGGGARLGLKLRGLSFPEDLAAPTLRTWLRVGASCFRAEVACGRVRAGLRCRP